MTFVFIATFVEFLIYTLESIASYQYKDGKMVQKHHVEGYDNFKNFVANFKSDGKTVHILFSSKKNEDGTNWCPYCENAWPIIQKCLEQAEPESHFVHVEVGDKPTWKDPQCPFRHDPKTKIRVLPTLVRWNSPQRLEGEQCASEDLVSLLFTDEE